MKKEAMLNYSIFVDYLKTKKPACAKASAGEGGTTIEHFQRTASAEASREINISKNKKTSLR